MDLFFLVGRPGAYLAAATSSDCADTIAVFNSIPIQIHQYHFFGFSCRRSNHIMLGGRASGWQGECSRCEHLVGRFNSWIDNETTASPTGTPRQSGTTSSPASAPATWEPPVVVTNSPMFSAQSGLVPTSMPTAVLIVIDAATDQDGNAGVEFPWWILAAVSNALSKHRRGCSLNTTGAWCSLNPLVVGLLHDSSVYDSSPALHGVPASHCRCWSRWRCACWHFGVGRPSTVLCSGAAPAAMAAHLS